MSEVETQPSEGREPGSGEVAFRMNRQLPFLDRAEEGDAEVAGSGGELLFGVVEAVRDPGDESLLSNSVMVFHREPVDVGERLIVRRDRVLELPADYPDQAAREAAFAGVAAVLMAEDLARLAPSDTVLVLGAGSPVGLACCHIARAVGARLLAGSEEDAEIARLEGNGFEVVDVRDPSWNVTCLKDVGRFGVDVILGASGGKLFDEAFAWVLGNFGRYVIYGPPGEDEITIDAEELRAGCKTVSGFRIAELAERNLERVVRGFRRYALLVRSEQVPLP